MFRSILYSLLGLVLSDLVSVHAFDDVPPQAIEAWEKKRVALLDLEPVRLSSDSFSAKITTNEVIEIEGQSTEKRKESLRVSKLDSSVLIERELSVGKEVTVYDSGRFYRLFQPNNETTWILKSTGEYSLDPPENRTKADKFWKEILFRNQSLNCLWALGNAPFSKFWNRASKISITNDGDILKVEARQGELPFNPRQHVLHEYDRMKEFALKKSTTIVIDDKSPSSHSRSTEEYLVTSLQPLSYTEVVTVNAIEDGVKLKSNKRSEIVVDLAKPPSEKFLLSHYGITLVDDPKSSNDLYFYLPAIAGVCLIAAAVWIRRRQ
jgi:hypothetical protein